MIKLEHIEKYFDTSKGKVHAVKDVSLNIKQGEIFGVIGFSGAGKSTIVRCINLLEKPDSGKVIIDGEDITDYSDKELSSVRQSIGMIFQHFNLMPSRTVFDNIDMPLKRTGMKKEDRIKKITKLLEFVELSDKAYVHPSQLSGGQKQRVAIARALACDPKILLCDEATSALDPKTTASILKLLKTLNEQLKLTIVIITHQMSVVKDICHRAAIMENGEVVECNDVYELFANPKTELGKKFIETSGSSENFLKLLHTKGKLEFIDENLPVYHLTYTGNATAIPLMSRLYAHFGIEANILYGNIDYIEDKPFGQLCVQLFGKEPNQDIEPALEFIRKMGVSLERIK